MAFQKIELGAEALALARRDYEAGTAPVDAVAAALGVSRDTLYAIIRRDGWTMRRPLGSRASTAAPTPKRALRRMTLPGQAAELARLSARNMEAIRRGLSAGNDPEKLTRAIAVQTRTLDSLRKLQAALQQDTPDDDAPPARSLHELRDELREHLIRLRAERGSRALAREAELARRRGLAEALAAPVQGRPGAAGG